MHNPISCILTEPPFLQYHDHTPTERMIFTMTVEKNMTLAQVLNADRNTARIFMEFGMHCLGCPHAVSETIEQACMAHGANCDELVHQLNEYFAEKQ